jgi:hypothetical protein
MDRANAPARLHSALSGPALLLRPEIREGQTGQRLFSSSWWPATKNGTAQRWNSANKNYGDWISDPDNVSPTEKYDLLFYPGQTRRIPQVRNRVYQPGGARGAAHVQPAVTVVGPTTAWELRNHGVYQRAYPEDWWGHCNGWASYSVAERGGAPLRDVRVKLVGGAIHECGAGEAGCVLFRMADIEALMSELYYNDAATIAGRRCNVEPDRIARDAHGRPTNVACRDANPATVHVALTGLLGGGAAVAGRPTFIMDHQYSREVWNFPIQRFSIDAIEEVDRARATALAGGYRFNENATRFARVKTRFWMVVTHVTNAELLRPAYSRRLPLTMIELDYVLEMDGAGRILGGEWIRAGARGDVHPDFLWLPARPQGAGEDADDRGGTTDNPYISYANVKTLLTLASTPGPAR